VYGCDVILGDDGDLLLGRFYHYSQCRRTLLVQVLPAHLQQVCLHICRYVYISVSIYVFLFIYMSCVGQFMYVSLCVMDLLRVFYIICVLLRFLLFCMMHSCNGSSVSTHVHAYCLMPYVRFKFIEPDIEWRNSDAGSEMLRSTDNFNNSTDDSGHFSG
jgi:hypothetical protein